MNPNNVIFIVGPTAVGKSEVGLSLAREINGEIISCDSMQIYKEINIASNKPSEEILKDIPHHLIDIVSVEEDFDVVQFSQLAQEAIEEVLKRNAVPIIVGGTGFYMQVLLDGIFDATPKNEALREGLYAQAQEHGTEALYEKLKEVDAEAAGKIHPNNLRKVIRALEVYMEEGKPISTLQKKRSGGIWDKYKTHVFALNKERELIYWDIETRVDEMFDQGLVEEVKKTSKLNLSPTARGLIGIKEIIGYLNAEYDEPQAKYLMKRNTRHFAKRQLTWFRHDERLEWIDVKDTQPANEIAKEIMQRI